MTVGIRHDDLRRRNRAMVIAAIRRLGRASRTELTAATGLSHSTISAISSSLITEGILREIEPEGQAVVGRRGRPQIALGLDPQAGCVLAIALSLNALSVTAIDYAGKELAHEISRPSTLTLERKALVSAVTAALDALLARDSMFGQRILRVTMAIQGITDQRARRLVWSPITPHRDIAFAEELEARLGVPVTIENDCNMIAVALRARDPERYGESFVALLLSNGIGTGLVMRGNLFTGTASSGGEFGHMIHQPHGALCRCGRRGCIEAYAGNYAIYRHARGESDLSAPAADIDDATMLALAAAARDHAGLEREAFHRAGEAIGFGLGSLFALTDPAPVAIVGLGASAFDIIRPALVEAIAQTAGGQLAEEISFDLQPDETPFIREGCARRALTFVDEELFASGIAADVLPGRQVA
jgi:predicted NBD/HSP70 family sugar kinase